MKINRQIQPNIATIDRLNLLHPTLLHLDNGIPCYQIDTGTQELIKLEFIFDAGLYYQSKKLVAALTNKMLSQGTKSYTAFDIADQMDRYGAHLESSVDKDKAIIAIYCLNKHLPKILPVLSEIITEPVFHEKEFHVLLNKTKQEYFINLEKVKFLAGVNFTKIIFGENHPYGMMIEKNDFDNLQLSDLQTFYKDHYRINNCKVIVCGKIPNALTDLLNTYFGTKEEPVELAQRLPKREDYSPGKHKIRKPGSLQSAIRIGKPLFNRLHPDYKKFSVLNTILGGYFGSRLMSNIREEKGYTYGINSSLFSLQQNGYFSIVTEVGAKYTDAAIEEIYKELKRLRIEKIPDNELKLVKNYITGQIIRSLDGPFSLAERLRTLIQYDLPNTYYQNFVEEIHHTTALDLIQIANQYITNDSLTELVVGD